MNNIIKFEIVTPERTVLKEEIVQVSVPTKEGEITVLPGHIPLVASLNPGVIEIVKEDSARDVMSVSGGFIEVSKDKVVILADTAERAEEIDETRVDAARKQAEDSVKNMRHFDQERFAGISAKIAKELARDRAAKRWKKIKSLDK
ncbi:ATP synthase F1 subunit epsilon [Candidatus Parcubacteria bacterium]|nr:ATP synthase F1 subunit epsilon [Candidatus Parcubacteria bacterium]